MLTALVALLGALLAAAENAKNPIPIATVDFELLDRCPLAVNVKTGDEFARLKGRYAIKDEAFELSPFQPNQSVPAKLESNYYTRAEPENLEELMKVILRPLFYQNRVQ